ncbi:MAG: DUF5672 family protein [Thermoplasmata archaeon]
MSFPKNFDWELYLASNKDLLDAGLKTKDDAIRHWINYGQYEDRKMVALPSDFDWEYYLIYHRDLIDEGLKTRLDALIHWIYYGRYEKRKYDNTNIIDWELYLASNKDLLEAGLKTKDDAIKHWVSYGQYEDRKILALPNDFDWKYYLDNHKDLVEAGLKTRFDVLKHWIYHGRYEGRIYCMNYINNNIDYYIQIKSLNNDSIDSPIRVMEHYKSNGNPIYDLKISIFNNLKIPNKERQYFFCIDDFQKMYYPSISIKYVYQKILEDPKVEHRYFCFRYLDYIRQLPIPQLSNDNTKEVVLIEFRKFPNIEFTLRNAIIKLGNSWNYTVVCGKNNKHMVECITQSISSAIRIISYECRNVTIDMYNLLLTSKDFWNKFVGEKILIIQDDACIFRNNIDEFLEYDYIGAPWNPNRRVNELNVGNGGLSLRSKNVMLKVIDKVKFDPSKDVYEDMYFSKYIINLKIGKIAPFDIAKKFSVQDVKYDKPFGGHCFWFCYENWKEILYNYVVIQFNPTINLIHRLDNTYHCYEWKYIINYLIKTDFFDLTYKSKYNFIDIMEDYCFNNESFYNINNPIISMIHGTNEKRLENINDYYQLKYLLTCEPFLKIKNKIIYSFTFFNYIKNYIVENNFFDSNKISVIKYPINLTTNIIFTFETFISNKDKCIIQVDQQMIYYDTIYKINVPGYKKIWLIKKLLQCDIFREKYKNRPDVEIKYIDDYNEYNTLISKNIVLCHSLGGNTSNAILEFIAKNIPIIVNKHPAIEEYLGTNYPLYFNNIDEIPNMLNENKIMAAYEYLKNMDKQFLSIKKFSENLFSTVHKVIAKYNNV